MLDESQIFLKNPSPSLSLGCSMHGIGLATCLCLGFGLGGARTLTNFWQGFFDAFLLQPGVKGRCPG